MVTTVSSCLVALSAAQTLSKSALSPEYSISPGLAGSKRARASDSVSFVAAHALATRSLPKRLRRELHSDLVGSPIDSYSRASFTARTICSPLGQFSPTNSALLLAQNDKVSAAALPFLALPAPSASTFVRSPSQMKAVRGAAIRAHGAAEDLRSYQSPQKAEGPQGIWSPETREEVTVQLSGIDATSYQRDVLHLRGQSLRHLGTEVPATDAFEQIAAFGSDWDEVQQLFLSTRPYKQVLWRTSAKEQTKDILEGTLCYSSLNDSVAAAASDQRVSIMKRAAFASSDLHLSSPLQIAAKLIDGKLIKFTESPMTRVDSKAHHCLSHLRKAHLRNPLRSPMKAAWSPGIGLFSNITHFLRKRFGIGFGRNISLAIARDPITNRLIYTVASTDGPPGGSHSELLAWDALPLAIKEQKRALIYSERQPCMQGSNCNAKLRETLGEGCFMIYSLPQIAQKAKSKKRFIARESLQELRNASQSTGLASLTFSQETANLENEH